MKRVIGAKKPDGVFYDYSRELPKASTDEALLQKVFERILMMLFNEAADALHWNIASREDIDLAMMKGMNFPKEPLEWAEEWGIGHCVQSMDDLFAYYHEERYRCSAGLRRMK